MFVSPKFKEIIKSVESGQEVIELTRKGVANKVILPVSLVKSIGHDINVDPTNNSVVISEGDSTYIIADEFGIVESKDEVTETTLFLIDGGVVIELISGKIALKGSNGDTFFVDEAGDIDYPDSSDFINWMDEKNLHELALKIVKHRYGIPNESLTETYINNLAFGVSFHYYPTPTGHVQSTKFVEQYHDLGLDKFVFVNFNEEEYEADEDTEDVSDLVDVEDEEEDDFDYDMDGDDDDYDEDEDEDEEDYFDSF